MKKRLIFVLTMFLFVLQGLEARKYYFRSTEIETQTKVNGVYKSKGIKPWKQDVLIVDTDEQSFTLNDFTFYSLKTYNDTGYDDDTGWFVLHAVVSKGYDFMFIDVGNGKAVLITENHGKTLKKIRMFKQI